MQFRRQLVVGYSALTFVLLLTGTVGVVAIRETTRRLEHVTQDLASEVSTLQRLRYQAENAVAASRRYLFTGEEVSADRFTRAVTRIDNTLVELERHRDELVPGMREVSDRVHRYVATARAAMAARGTANEVQVAALFEQQLAPVRDELESTIADYVARERESFANESKSADSLADEMAAIMVVATAAGVAASIALALLWIKKLAQRYALEREATATAKRALAARDEMLAIVSHDLRTPLSTVAMGASLLQMDEASSPLARKHVGSIANAAQRMDHLIAELLDVAKLDAGKLELRAEPCSVGELLDATSSLFETRAAEAHVELTFCADGVPAVLADRERVLQVLSNLVSNAIKYTPAGGHIEVRASGSEIVKVAISDTGSGIAADALPHVFERYWQARARGRGSLGLGLYICKQLVEAHRGHIGVTSEVGKGTTFWFELPRSPGPDAAACS